MLGQYLVNVFPLPLGAFPTRQGGTRVLREEQTVEEGGIKQEFGARRGFGNQTRVWHVDPWRILVPCLVSPRKSVQLAVSHRGAEVGGGEFQSWLNGAEGSKT